MAYSKTKKILFILLCLFVILFPFWCVRGLCAEREEVTPATVAGVQINVGGNSFITSQGSCGYVEIEKGYIYYIDATGVQNCSVAVSNEIPVLNGTYTYLGRIGQQQELQVYSYIADNNNTYIYLDYSWATGVKVYREKISSMNGAVDELVDNVGINSIWNIFDISINYIIIVVVFALGCFIIFKLIKKVSKGKEGF